MPAAKAMSPAKNASMPAIGTPSIVQQRIALVVFLGVIGGAVWWQNIGGNANYPVQKFSKTPVLDVVGELDFTSAEAAWSGLNIDPQGNLKIDSVTETALGGAIAVMHDQPSERASALTMARMALLLEKQFGPTASQQIMALLPIVKNYKEIEQRFWAENGNKNPPPHAQLFQLQDELLGKTLAEKLFSQQRRLAKVMLASHQIRSDTSLTQAEKEQALMELQKTLQEEGASSE
jgi:hypothetical protein